MWDKVDLGDFNVVVFAQLINLSIIPESYSRLYIAVGSTVYRLHFVNFICGKQKRSPSLFVGVHLIKQITTIHTLNVFFPSYMCCHSHRDNKFKINVNVNIKRIYE